MKIKLGMKAVIYKTVEKIFTDSATGKEVPYYQAVIEQNGDIESIGITLSAVNKVKVMEENQLICEFDTTAKRPKVRIVDVK